MRPFKRVFVKSPLHGRALDILGVLSPKEGISLKSLKREVLDYLIVLLREHIPKIRGNNPAKILKTLEDYEDIAHKLAALVNLSLISNMTLTKTAGIIGRIVLAGHEPVKLTTRQKNLLRVRVGIELLDMLRLEKKISFRRESPREVPQMMDKDVVPPKNKKSKAPYKIKVLDEAFIFKVSLGFYLPDKERPIYVQPLLAEPFKWEKFEHDVHGDMVRNIVPGVQKEFSIYKIPIVYEFMNRIKEVSFKVNQPLLDVYLACQEDEIFTHKRMKYKPLQLSSIMRQQNEILRVAGSLEDEEFWLSSFLDFRGRFYYANTYFHPQGNKISRSLFKFSKKKKIKKSGWKAMLRAAASEYGYDKLHPNEKYEKALEHFHDWLVAASNPYSPKNKEVWQKADNPFGFLAVMMEIYQAWLCDDKYEYESNMPIFVDASNSGTQHLSAMGRDPIGGELSNLMESDTRGDVYGFIADAVWEGYKPTIEDRELFDRISSELGDIIERKDAAHKSQDWDLYAEIQDEYSEFYTDNKDEIRQISKVFWYDLYKSRRTICKRPVMTIPYSAGVRTIAKSLLLDWRSDPDMDGIQGTYCFELAMAITAAYSEKLKIPTDLMNLFIKTGLHAYSKGKDFQFKSPLTGFPFVQNTRADIMEGLQIKKRKKRIDLSVCTGPSEKVNYQDVKSASSPNAIHALDAAFLMAVTLALGNTPMMLVHDSFATYPGSYKKLNKQLRDTFVSMYKDQDVLLYLLQQNDCEDFYKDIDKGDLDIDGILNNPYAFDL